MNEKELELQLLQNSKYSSAWVQNAISLMIKHNLSEEEAAKYNAEQLQLIASAFAAAEQNEGIWIEGFLNPELNATQMQLLLAGYSNGATTEELKLFFDPSIPYVKSNWYITALTEGFDLNEYDINAYNPNQIYEIYAGKKDNVDVTVYDNADISSEKMAVARHALAIGLKVEFDENKKLTIY